MSVFFPGDAVGDNLIGGAGTYVCSKGLLRASLVGQPVYENSMSEADDTGVLKKKVNIVSSSRINTSATVIAVGDTVLAQVMKIGVNQANVEILAVGDNALRDLAKGVVRREDIRMNEIDKLVVRECFRPGDIIKAQVISLGRPVDLQIIPTDNTM